MKWNNNTKELYYEIVNQMPEYYATLDDPAKQVKPALLLVDETKNATNTNVFSDYVSHLNDPHSASVKMKKIIAKMKEKGEMDVTHSIFVAENWVSKIHKDEKWDNRKPSEDPGRIEQVAISIEDIEGNCILTTYDLFRTESEIVCANKVVMDSEDTEWNIEGRGNLYNLLGKD